MQVAGGARNFPNKVVQKNGGAVGVLHSCNFGAPAFSRVHRSS